MDDILQILKKTKSFTDLEPLVEEEGQPSLSFLNKNQNMFVLFSTADARIAFFKYFEFFTFANYLEKVRVFSTKIVFV